MNSDNIKVIMEQFGFDMDEQNADIVEKLAVLMIMPDSEFVLISDNALHEFEKSINNSDTKLQLAQGLNANGLTTEDLTDRFIEFMAIIDDIAEITAIKRVFIKRLLGALVNAINETEGVSKRIIQIPIELCHENAKVPTYAHMDDAGMDIYALDDYIIHPGELKILPLGFKTALPPGYAMLIQARSGLSSKTKMRLANSVGLVDSGYRNEYGLIVENIEPEIKNISYDFNEDGTITITSIEHGSDVCIGKGERIAQLRLVEVPKANFYQVESVDGIGEDRGGGYGSSGKY